MRKHWHFAVAFVLGGLFFAPLVGFAKNLVGK